MAWHARERAIQFPDRAYLLHLAKVFRPDTDNVFAKLLLDVFHLVPRLLIVHKEDRDTLAAESTGTTYVCSQAPGSN
jgi:hypothetical protein